MDEEIVKTLLKKATGYTFDEIQEEYAIADSGTMTLTKRKVTSKYYPPDSAALKTYLELAADSDRVVASMTDEQLAKEKKRLLKELRDTNKKNRGNVPEGTPEKGEYNDQI